MRLALLSLLLVGLSLAAIRSAAAQPASPTCSITDNRVTEGQDDPHFHINCTNVPSDGEQISYATSDQTATAPDDYVAMSGELDVPPGSSGQGIVVDVVDDPDPEEEETFLVTLSDPEDIVAFDRQATGTIQDNDAQPAGPCITLSETAISVSAPLSTASRREFAGPLDRIQLTSCSAEDVGLRVRGTNATGPAGTWALTDASSVGPIDSTCELGTDLYRGSLMIWNEQGGANEGATLTTQGADADGPNGAFVLHAATEREMSINVEMPCEGSTGLDQPMSMEVVITAIAVP